MKFIALLLMTLSGCAHKKTIDDWFVDPLQPYTVDEETGQITEVCFPTNYIVYLCVKQ